MSLSGSRPSKNIQALLLIFLSPQLRPLAEIRPIRVGHFWGVRADTLDAYRGRLAGVSLVNIWRRELTAERTSGTPFGGVWLCIGPFTGSEKIKKARYILINITLTTAKPGSSLFPQCVTPLPARHNPLEACLGRAGNIVEPFAVYRPRHTLYGLGAGVWTRNGNRAYRFGRAIQAGRVWTNCYHAYPAHAAFGGYKQSGIGRETHKMMLDHYQQTKNVLVSYSNKALGFF